ncbi:MAG: sigma-70 family RNA polymerase sigma factor [Myxococcaceae bacterium]|nr:sigma-70 family RNA polymerase sigma factor [Myxococcaceae bacterium]MCI0672647.1 sigma-70 family RNA polymerase sigma factor [Myxococcaceae bacterium]
MKTSERHAAFQAWLCAHLGTLVKVARAFAATDADRDDLLQELLVALWDAAPSFQGQSQASTFVYRVAHNRALNWKRARTRLLGRRTLHTEWTLLTAPDEDAATRERLEQLYAALRTLEPLDRTLMLLSLDGLSYAEMSEVSGLTANHVGVRLTRARAQLKRVLGAREEGHG